MLSKISRGSERNPIEISLSYKTYPKCVWEIFHRKWPRKKRAKSFEMFIQFHELPDITINSRGASRKFFAIHRRGLFELRRNLFDTNDYAFMIFSRWFLRNPFANCGSAKHYLHLFLLMLFSSWKTKTYKTIHNLCAQMNVCCFLSILPSFYSILAINKLRENARRWKLNNIVVVDWKIMFNLNIYARTTFAIVLLHKNAIAT